jgi:predicted amidophosphoribosyltransferase
MIDPTTITDELLIKSLSSTTCPCCGKKKNSRHTFCGYDYHRLPRAMANALYGLIATGRYKPAVIEALKYLGAETFNMPKEATEGHEAPQL